jgi:hypothetical protein
MSSTSLAKISVVASDKLKRTEVWGETDPAVHWAGAFAVYGGSGTTASSTIVYEVEPGKRLGWHTDATEETQYIIAGTGKLYLEGWDRAACSFCRRPCATIWRTPARRRCARWPSSPRRCSPRISTR